MTSRRLCDDNGIVGQALVDPQPIGDEFLTYRGLHNRLAALSGREPISEDFACTGSAHYGSEHINCTSPAHRKPPEPWIAKCDSCGWIAWSASEGDADGRAAEHGREDRYMAHLVRTERTAFQ